MKTCTSCSATFIDSAKFCPKCGTAAPVGSPESAAPSTSPVTSAPPPMFSAKTPPPPPPPRAAPKPAQASAPEPKPQAKKSNTMVIGLVAAVVVVAVIIGVMSTSSKKEDQAAVQPQQAPAAQSVQPSVPAEQPVQKAQVIEQQNAASAKVDQLINDAKAAYARNEYDRTIALLDAALAIDPDNKPAVLLRQKAVSDQSGAVRSMKIQ